jgi:hypothetical protein
VDERDVMFARAARRPGTPAYEDYYRRHPERQAVDDRLRALPELLLPGGRHYDERTCRDAIHYFHAIDEIAINAKDVERWASEARAIGDVTHAVRDGLLRHGALGVGFAPIDPSAVYSHKGRFDGDYGQPVELRHPAAVVFLVEMDFDAMQHAPRAEVIASRRASTGGPRCWPGRWGPRSKPLASRRRPTTTRTIRMSARCSRSAMTAEGRSS